MLPFTKQQHSAQVGQLWNVYLCWLPATRPTVPHLAKSPPARLCHQENQILNYFCFAISKSQNKRIHQNDVTAHRRVSRETDTLFPKTWQSAEHS